MNILGIDVGSTVAKFALIDHNSNVVFLCSKKINGDPVKCVHYMLERYKKELIYDEVAITGSSRNLIAQEINATLTKTEILAHICGVLYYYPNAKTIIEIGGQDSKYIAVENGIVSDFRMNAVCAAGTGAFIESQAYKFGVTINEMDEIAITSNNHIELKAKCGILLESAIINLQRTGVNKDDIMHSVFLSLANNYYNTLCNDIDVGDEIVFIGGVAKIKTMRKCFEKIFSRQIIVPENCEYMGAIGIALLLKNEYDCNSKFLSSDIEYKQCNRCINRCFLNVLKTETGYYLSGGLCDKRFHVKDLN